MPTALAIIPHPDDESYSFGGTLAILADAGWRIEVRCASAGEKGHRHDRGRKDQMSVAAARLDELEDSCRVLGAGEPLCWGLPDGGLRFAPSQARRVAETVRLLTPDIILSLGEDGAYGHPDHLAVYRWIVDGLALLPAPQPAWLRAAFPPGLFLPQYEKCIGMMGEPPSLTRPAIGSAVPSLEVDIRPVRHRKLAAIAAHRSQLPGGDPEALFPPGIIAALLATERFVCDASAAALVPGATPT